MSIKRLLLVFLATQLLLFGCQATPPAPIEFDEQNLNHQIVLKLISPQNSYKTRDTLFINFTLHTQNTIIFPNNYNLRLFLNENGMWKEIDETPRIRLPEGDFVFESLTAHQLPGFYVKPVLTDYDKKQIIRIYISGEMDDGASTTTVASFIDVTLRP